MQKLRWCDYGAMMAGLAAGVLVGKYGKAIYDEVFPVRQIRNWEKTCEEIECECDDDYSW